MSCNSTPCTCTENCSPCQSTGCPINLDASCVFYGLTSDSPSLLTCINANNGDSLASILEALDAKVCEASPNVNSYSLPCLRNKYSITTLKQFAESVDTELCYLASYISDTKNELEDEIDALSGVVTSIYTPGISNCGSLGILPSDTILNVLQKYADKLCLILSTCCSEDSPSIVATNSQSISFVTTGTKNHNITASAIISPDAGNLLTLHSNGLYCTVTVPNYTQVLSFNSGTNVLTLSNGGGSVTLNTPSAQTLSFNCTTKILSISGGNTVDLTCIAGASLVETALIANDTSTIDFTTSGTSGHILTGSVKISPDAGNVISAHANGIYASASSDMLVKLNSADPTAGYLEDKITGKVNSLITVTTTSNNASHKTEVEGVLDVSALLTAISSNNTLLTALCNIVKSCICLTFVLKNTIGNGTAYTYNYVDCNGSTHTGVSLADGATIQICARSVTPNNAAITVQCLGLC